MYGILLLDLHKCQSTKICLYQIKKLSISHKLGRFVQNQSAKLTNILLLKTKKLISL